MKLVTLSCPKCGASLEIKDDRKQVFCEYCGAKIVLDDDSVNITHRYVDEARLKEAEVRLRELDLEREKEKHAYEREQRELEIVNRQKRAERISIIVSLTALALILFFSSAEITIPLLIVGIIVLSAWRSGDRKALASYRTTDLHVSDKSNTVALCLCIFLGIFGIHHFYVGKVGMGILYFFTFGLFGFGWIVDIIRIVCGVFRDRDGLPLR